MTSLPDVEKFDDMCNSFDTIPALEERTDGEKCHINIAQYNHFVAVVICRIL